MANFINHKDPAMIELKQRTLVSDNIAQTDGYFRYVNHADQLATTGFGTREALLKYTYDLRFDSGTVEAMRERYLNL